MMGKPLQPPPLYTSLLADQKYGTKSNYESKAKGVSISASILSIVIYVLVFYIFDLSPSLVFNSSKFWFFLSNTLIIIIAADYGYFSSSCDKVDDPYDEYVAESRQPMSTSYHQSYYTHTTPITSSPLHLKTTNHCEESNDDEDKNGVVEVKKMIFSTSMKSKEQEEEEVTNELVVGETWKVPTQDSIWESISKEANDKVQKENVSPRNIASNAGKDRKKVKNFRRTVSEKLSEATQVEKRERKNAIHRWESELHEPLVAHNENEDQELQDQEMGVDDQFAAMTNEELNKRVEEFIQKFNSQIRLERNIDFQICTQV